MASMSRPKALIFDVFGTLVDWRGSVARQLSLWIADEATRHAFADAWRARYQPAMEAVRAGRRPFVPLDTLHRENLDAVLEDFGMGDVANADRDRMTLFWHTLDAWPDVGQGLSRLSQRFLLAPHSNGNVRLMADMARHNGWRWDAVLGAEVTGFYKPRPESYLRAAELLMLAPHEVAMVAAHNDDLAAARRCGLGTCFIARPAEHGPHQTTDLAPREAWDAAAPSLTVLADMLCGTG
jgi:2-haloacid dehalogenase